MTFRPARRVGSTRIRAKRVAVRFALYLLAMLAMGSAQTPMSDGADHPWAPGPTHARLTEGAVHVWRTDLTAVKDELAQLLCGDERARAEGILGERQRRLWSRSRGVLRALLG